jgi:protein transport protein SEC23
MCFKENVSNSLVMIQPALMMYKLDSDEAMPVLLDGDSMQDSVVLLLDTFFYVSIWKGQTICDWEKAGYHEQPDYANLKNLLEVPVEDAQYIMQERFPMPRFYVTSPDDTNERKFKARLNPSSGTPSGMDGEQKIASEDVSLNVFMQHLIQKAVQS